MYLLAPFTFAKLHGCIPKTCKCPNATRFEEAFDASVYLKPMIAVIEDMTLSTIKTVSTTLHMRHNWRPWVPTSILG